MKYITPCYNNEIVMSTDIVTASTDVVETVSEVYNDKNELMGLKTTFEIAVNKFFNKK